MSEPLAQASSEPAIRARGVVKKFGSVTAVDGIDLDVPQQVIYGFLGPNGSGKSTTIRVLLGLLTPSAGEVEVLGMKIPSQAEKVRRQSGYMTQNFSLYRDLSIRENLSFVARVYGLGSRQARQRIEEILDQYDLRPFADRRAGMTSGGQRQRLALAAAVLHKPRLLVLDEPTSAVDPQNRRDFWDKLFALVEGGTTILVSTHYMDEAERCHYLAILKKGRVAAVGSPPEMLQALAGRTYGAYGGNLSTVRRGLAELKAIESVSQLGARLRILTTGMGLDALRQAVQALDPTTVVDDAIPSLEDVFVDATRDPEEPGMSRGAA